MEEQAATELKRCACGCGAPVQGPQSRWARDHSRRGTPEQRALCACGCGVRVGRACSRYLKGHAQRLQWSDYPVCACGCGTRLKQRGSLWVRGHSSRRYCACGCGTPIEPPHRFVKDHHKRKPGEIGLCACGCGHAVARIGNRFLKGHSTRLRYAHKSDPGTFPFCKCGCGQRVTKPANGWLRGHQMRVLDFSGPTPHEILVQRGFHARGRAFLFNIGLAGMYRPDFQFPEAKLIVEVDGYDHTTAVKRRRDRERDAALGKLGWRILRWRHGEIEQELEALLAAFDVLYQSRLFSCRQS